MTTRVIGIVHVFVGKRNNVKEKKEGDEVNQSSDCLHLGKFNRSFVSQFGSMNNLVGREDKLSIHLVMGWMKVKLSFCQPVWETRYDVLISSLVSRFGWISSVVSWFGLGDFMSR